MKAYVDKMFSRINALIYITQTWHLSEVVDMTFLPNVTGVCGGHICVQCVWCVCVCADGMVPALFMGSSRIYCEECSEF